MHLLSRIGWLAGVGRSRITRYSGTFAAQRRLLVVYFYAKYKILKIIIEHDITYKIVCVVLSTEISHTKL